VRVWTESPEGEFRARVTAVDTSSAGPPGAEVAVTASPGELLDAVRDWLDEFLHPGA